MINKNLLHACKEALRWHQGDKWRNSKKIQNRVAWQIQHDLLTNAIAEAEGKQL